MASSSTSFADSVAHFGRRFIDACQSTPSRPGRDIAYYAGFMSPALQRDNLSRQQEVELKASGRRSTVVRANRRKAKLKAKRRRQRARAEGTA